MKAGRTNARGQLVRLEDRMSKAQLERRAAKIEARKSVAQNLAQHIGIARGMSNAVANYAIKSRRIHYSIEAVLSLLVAMLFYSIQTGLALLVTMLFYSIEAGLALLAAVLFYLALRG